MPRYLDFFGNASRAEYWLIHIAAPLLLGLMAWVLMQVWFSTLLLTGGVLITAWLCLATAVRRCREAGISPWWTASFFLPYLNLIALVVIGVLAPKAESATPAFSAGDAPRETPL